MAPKLRWADGETLFFSRALIHITFDGSAKHEFHQLRPVMRRTKTHGQKLV